MKTGADILEAAVQTFRERNEIYNDNYLRLAKASNAMFPTGLTLQTEDDWVRLYFFLAIVTKLSRYATNWKTGHKDSIHDAVVYSAMLEAYDE